MDPAQPAPAEDHVYLVGLASLHDFLEFMTTQPVGAAAFDRRMLATQWRSARDRLIRLRRSEEAWADDVRPQPLPPDLEPLAALVAADPIYQTAFAAVPTRLALVELDRLVVTQKTIQLAHVYQIREILGASPTSEAVFRLCLPFDHPTPGHRVARVGPDSIVFVSNADDLRFLDSVVLDAGQVTGYRAVGPVAGVVGLVVGFGSGYLNVIASEGRLVLHNGYHRAYALRELGVTRIPAVVQEVRTASELGAAAGGALRRNPERYLQTPRPPVFKDYFDPELRTVVSLVPTARHVRVRFTIEEEDRPR